MRSAVDKNSREYLENKMKSARHSLLLVIIFTIVNLVLLLADGNTYFLFSASVPFYLTVFGMGMDAEMGISVFTTTALVISAVILAAYLLCWIFSKRKVGWYTVALVLFIIDTALLVLMALSFDVLADSIMDGIYKEFTAKQHGYGDVIRAYACILITMFARIYFDTEPEQIHLTPPDNRRQILFAVDFLKTNYAEEISLDEIAQRSALSKSSFCRIFKELTGETFHAYLNRCRINGAKEYIKKGYKISGIYGLCGYSDFSTFYRNFKKITGMSPAAYQQKVR